jgi:hypothetical protein
LSLQRSQPSHLPLWLPNLQSRTLVAWPRPPTLQSRPPTAPPWLALGSWPPTHGHFRPLCGPSCPRPRSQPSTSLSRLPPLWYRPSQLLSRSPPLQS